MQDLQDREDEYLPYFALTKNILGCCFAVMKELGPGFLERVYKNALFLALKQEGLRVETEKLFEVQFRGQVIGRYSADLIAREGCDCRIEMLRAFAARTSGTGDQLSDSVTVTCWVIGEFSSQKIGI